MFTENLEDFHEGDIRLSRSQRLSLELLGDPTAKFPFARGITNNPQKLWSTLVVPYNITPDLGKSTVSEITLPYCVKCSFHLELRMVDMDSHLKAV